MTSQLPRFWCLFLSCQQQKNTGNGAAVTSLRSFLFRDVTTLVTSGHTLTKSQCGKHDLVLCTASNLRVANVAQQRAPLVKHIAHRKILGPYDLN